MYSEGLVSIVIPVYNAQELLKKTLDSVISQTYTNIEIILINDGSVDDSQLIIDDFVKRYPDIVKGYSQKNMGQSATRNNALDNYVHGEYVGFVDADDLLAPDYIFDLLTACKNNDADVSVIGYEKFDSFTNEIFYVHSPENWKVNFDNGKEYVFQYSPWGKLFRTEFLNKNAIRFSVGEILEDGPFSIETNLIANKIIAIDKLSYKYRANKITSTGKAAKKVSTSSTMGTFRQKNAKPKLPYNGIISVIKNVKQHNKTPEEDEILEYCIIKALAGYATNMGKYMDKTTRKELCDYCYKTIKEFFPHVHKNPYIKINKLNKLPLTHRVAVKLFIMSYRLKMLYPFSLVVSKVL